MAIKFNQFQSKIEEIYTPRAEDEKRFASKHVVAVTKDAAGNDADFATKGMKGKAKRLADREDEEQKKVYEYNYSYPVPNQIAYEDDDQSEVEPEEKETDYEGEMAKAELRAIASKAGALAQMMDDEMDLEAWLQSKISVAKKDIDTVYDYVVFSMMPRMNSEQVEYAVEMLSEEAVETLDEVLRKSDSAGKWISDFVHSDNPKFKGKSKKQRMKQALAAYYAKQRNESVEQIDEISVDRVVSYMHKAEKSKKKAEGENKAWGKVVGPGSTPERKTIIKRTKGLKLADKKFSGGAKVDATEEVNLGEGVVDVFAKDRKDDSHKLQDWSKAKLDKHRKIPHGSHSRADIEDEHKRRIKTSEYEMRSKSPVKEDVDLEEARVRRSSDYLGTVHKDDPKYDEKIAAFKKDHVVRIRGRAPTPEHKSKYARGGELHRSSSQDVKPEHASRVDVYSRGKKKSVKEEVESLEELSKKTLASYVDKAVKDKKRDDVMYGVERGGRNADTDASRSARERYTSHSQKRHAGINKAVSKLAKEEVELEEAKRGRPRKDGSSSGDDEGGREHIVMQLRKAINLRGQKHVEFNSGEKHQVPVEHAKKALDMHDSMKKAEDKQEFASRLAKSHGSFKDAISGKPAEPKKPKITLAKFAGKK